MGIRCSKTLAWGSLNIKPSDSFEKIYNYEDEEAQGFYSDKYNLDNFKKFTDDKTENNINIVRIMLDRLKTKHVPIYSVISFDNDDFFGFTPLSDLSYRRYGDVIDHIENQYLEKLQIKWLDNNPYPYNGTYINKKTKEYISYDFSRMIEMLKSSNLFDEETLKINQETLIENGFESVKDCIENTICAIPQEIIFLCEFLGVFDNLDDVYELKPCLLTYWN